MTPIDANYSYDELEGFEMVKRDPYRKTQRKGIVCTISQRIALSRDSLDAMGDPEAVQVLLDHKQKRMMVVKVQPDTPNSWFIGRKGRCRCCINDARLIRDLEKIVRYDLNMVNVYAKGYKSKTKRDAVIYDLAHIESVPRKKMKTS